MLRSLPFDLTLVVIVVGLFKWFVEPMIGYPWIHALALLLAVTWVLAATQGARIVRRLPGPVRRFLRRG